MRLQGDFRKFIEEIIPLIILKLWDYIKQRSKKLQKFYHEKILTCIRDISHFLELYMKKK